MKTWNILIAAFSCLLLATGCKMDVVPPDRYTDATIWNNPDNAKLYLFDQYDVFKPFTFGRFPIGYSNATDALTDLVKYTATVSGNGTANMIAFSPGMITGSSPTFAYWADAYIRIYAINNFLYGIEQYKTFADEKTKLAYQGEARLLRAYVYFWLVRLHGSVVLLDKPVNTNNNPRSSEDECWNFIAADLAFAAEHLPKERTGADLGRATKGAAYGLLARTWLYAASIAEYDQKAYNADPLTGVPAAKKDAYYKNAADAAAEVMKLEEEGVYKLNDTYAGVFNTRSNKEMILWVQFKRPTVTHTIDRDFSPPADQTNNGAMGVPTAELADEFEMADGSRFSWNDPVKAAAPYTGREPRFYATVLYNGATWKSRVLNTSAADVKEGYVEYASQTDPKRTVTGYYTRKFLDETNLAAVANGSEQPSIEMRYAEVLLIYAEAMTKLNDLGKAAAALNKVRARVKLPVTAAATPAEMMTAIEHERKVELAYEGHRYWDLRRWRKAHSVLNNVRFHGHKPVAQGTGFRYELVDCDKQDRLFATQTYYLPLPVAEVTNNPSLTQIQGW